MTTYFSQRYEFEDAEVYFGDDCEEIVADAGNNADLYAANQGSTELINEARSMEEGPVTFHGSRRISSSAA